jgi:hypothetical protein
MTDLTRSLFVNLLFSANNCKYLVPVVVYLLLCAGVRFATNESFLAHIDTHRARKLEHKLGSPQRKFEPFKRNILPHLDSDDAVSVTGSDIDSELAELYSRR